jgi:ABC-type glycerol-3-phosphate transport system substrate-binding protein
MKKLLALLMLSGLMLAACGQTDDMSDDSTLSDMYDYDDVDGTEDEVTDDEEFPPSVGPTSIPDDLVPSR